MSNLPKNEVEIVEENIVVDWSHLEAEIDKGMQSGVSDKSHESVVSEIRQKYA